MNARERYQLWLDSPDIDEATQEELRAKSAEKKREIS